MTDVLFLVGVHLVDDQGRVGAVGVESDVHHHLNAALESAGRRVRAPTFRRGEAGHLEIEPSGLAECLAGSTPAYGIVDTNHPLPLTPLGRLTAGDLRDRLPPMVGLVPDCYPRPALIEVLRSWDPLVARFVGLGTNPVTRPWVREHGGAALADKLTMVPSMPVVRPPAVPKLVDFSYLGTAKPFRLRLLRDVVRSERPIVIATCGRSSGIFSRTREYLSVLAASRTTLVTRAFPYLYATCEGRRRVHPGPYAGRLSEAIAAGVVPLYWGGLAPGASLVGRALGRLGCLRKDPGPPLPGLEEGRHYLRIRNARGLLEAVDRVGGDEDLRRSIVGELDEVYRQQIDPVRFVAAVEESLGASART